MTKRRQEFDGDWLAGVVGGPGRRKVGKTDGVGPVYTEEKCEACGSLIQASGECRCSS